MMTIEKDKTIDKAQIKNQIDRFIKAFCTKDLELMMSLYTEDFVSFDVVPPLQDEGRETYRTIWKKTFALFEDGIIIEIGNVNITIGDNVAFSHNLLTNGKAVLDLKPR